MKTVYLLYHSHDSAEGDDNYKLLGIFSTEKKAQDAIDSFRLKPGFVDYPDDFSIDKYEIDKAYWSEGFAREP
jgi:hypothetical protein